MANSGIFLIEYFSVTVAKIIINILKFKLVSNI